MASDVLQDSPPHDTLFVLWVGAKGHFKYHNRIVTSAAYDTSQVINFADLIHPAFMNYTSSRFGPTFGTLDEFSACQLALELPRWTVIRRTQIQSSNLLSSQHFLKISAAFFPRPAVVVELCQYLCVWS